MKKTEKNSISQCESCVYWDEDPYTGEIGCTMDMDEDDYLARLLETAGKKESCPYYRYYHEYKSVQKQN